MRTTVGDWDGLECAAPAQAKPSRARRAAGVLTPIAVIGVFAVLVLYPAGDAESLPGLRETLAVGLIPVLGPLLIWAVIRVVHPGMLGDLPVIQQLQGMLPKREKA